MKKLVILPILILITTMFIVSSNATRPDNAALIVDSLKYEPYPAESGNYVNVWIKMENYGNDKTDDATFILEPEFPFSLDSNEQAERNLGQLDPAEEVVLEYKIRIADDAVEGNNELKLKFTTDEKAWITHTFDIFVRTHDTMLNTQEVIVEPSEVAPGEIATLSLKLKNMADSQIKDLRAELELTRRDILTTSVEYSELPFTPVSSTNVLMANSLRPLEEKIFTFELRVDPDTEPKVYRVPLTLTYSDELGNTTYEEESIISIIVSQKPDIMVNLDAREVYTKKSKGDISIGIYNIGVSEIKFSIIEILPAEGYKILSNPKNYLGNIDSDDYETADFDIYITEENPELQLLLNYKDAYNNEHQDIITIPLETYSKSESKKYGFIEKSNTFGTIIFLLILIALGWYWYKKRKQRKKKK